MYVFASPDGGASWSERQKLVASDGASGDKFSNSFDIDENALVAGAWSKTIAGSKTEAGEFPFALE